MIGAKNAKKETSLLLMRAMLSDTNNLYSETTTDADCEALKTFGKYVGVDDTDAFYRDMHKALISFEGMTDEEIFFSDYKEYERANAIPR